MKSTDLVYASDVEEFFWEEDDVSVPEGTPVGYEVEVGNSIDFILFKDIYWKVEDDYEEVPE
ncbi:MAG: hypothetical protein CBC05_08525 [Crocinitomicaceae bacterium TMED45]|nr:MAG: hypothetical protein CBC05_08525 [Crocinitomicaceae bacterium TMED45]|tara:strand:- start:32780 stop:32965 length:186 start_codon:yes stop_codon:yes gene_type:complete